MIQRNLLSFWFYQFATVLFLSILAFSVVAEENPKQKRTEISKCDLQSYQMLARVAYQIGKEDLSLPEDGMTDTLMTYNGPLEASINKLTPIAGSNIKSSEAQEISCNAIFDCPEFPIAKADTSIPVIMVLSCEDSATGHVWTDFNRPLLRISKGQPTSKELSMGRSSSMNPGKYILTAMLFVKLSPEKSLALLDLKRTQFTVEPVKSNQKQMKTSERDLQTYQILTRVAYQIGKDDFTLPKDSRLAALMTENGPIEAWIHKLTPVAGTSTMASESQVISCNTKYNWPEFPISKADLLIPTFLIFSCEDSKSRHVWTQYSRPELRIQKGNLAVAGASLSRSSFMNPGKYMLTAMMFLKLSPESPLTLLDFKRTQFTVEAEKKKTQYKQKSDGLKEKSKK